MRHASFAFAAFALAFAAAPTARADKQRLTIDDVIALGLKANPQLAGAREQSRAAHARAWSSGSRMLPSVHLSEEYQHYDKPFSIDFGAALGGLLPTGTAVPDAPFTVRDQDTNQFVASADQPLLGLLRLSQDYLAAKRNADASSESVKVAESALREALASTYLRVFQAQAREQIAYASEAELKEQVAVARAKLKAGTITQADLLRVQVAASNARQQAIAAHAQGVGFRAALLGALDLDPASDVELVEPTQLLQERGTVDEVDGQKQAVKQRPEVAQARLAAAAAKHSALSAGFSFLPDVDLEGAYINIQGQKFAPENQWFVGIRASWAIWEWGATFFQERAAAAQHRAAKKELEHQKSQARVDVTTRKAQLDATITAVAVATEAVASAQEAYRITEAQVKAGTATTTDLLDAQAALTSARLQLASASYDEAIARVALHRALGG